MPHPSSRISLSTVVDNETQSKSGVQFTYLTFYKIHRCKQEPHILYEHTSYIPGTLSSDYAIDRYGFGLRRNTYIPPAINLHTRNAWSSWPPGGRGVATRPEIQPFVRWPFILPDGPVISPNRPLITSYRHNPLYQYKYFMFANVSENCAAVSHACSLNKQFYRKLVTKNTKQFVC